MQLSPMLSSLMNHHQPSHSIGASVHGCRSDLNLTRLLEFKSPGGPILPLAAMAASRGHPAGISGRPDSNFTRFFKLEMCTPV
jgi:hypothetical protein